MLNVQMGQGDIASLSRNGSSPRIGDVHVTGLCMSVADCGPPFHVSNLLRMHVVLAFLYSYGIFVLDLLV